MKNTFLIMGITALLYAGPIATFDSVARTKNTVDDGWKKVKNAAWPEKDGMWYKIDASERLAYSRDGKKWESVSDGIWQDKDGRFIKRSVNKLIWSSDGWSWEEVPDWQWKAADGKWYRLDRDWNLWVKE
jgi:hypothetical protein